MKKVFKIIFIVLAVVIVGGLISKNYILDRHPQLLIGLFQGYQNQNSFEPRNGAVPGQQVKGNGILYLNDIKYGGEYPNSYLDISYPNENVVEKRPTFIYIHGGGFFGGDKALGDPLAQSNDSTFLYDSIVLEGYNLVNINYALVPQYRFPVPEMQLHQALTFLVEHAEEYHLDMHNVTIMGQSGGAILAGQYGAMIANPEYAKLYNTTPVLNAEDINALVIDDAPYDWEHFNRTSKRLLGNFISGNIFSTEEQITMYNPTSFVNENYPRSFILGNNYDGNGYAHDMEKLSNKLKENNVEVEFYYEKYADGTEPGHGFLSDLKKDELAQKAYEKMMSFVNKK
ncbi:alpha/beta hydrolase [Paenibacillus peoriae]|uniref:alpha/beta hydrolase n=1 Tax=Paenibacillus peoriae TaxID=59893 RepID=UPI000CEB9F3B|nr:alpha/beta hydrolase [Paenibacillus peoriae]PPQ49282.1 alpha/beta hydrolase [Paenibacillus peoriae]